MAILKIARLGHPVLLQRAEAVPDPTTPEMRRLVADMVETLADIGGLGLAAPASACFSSPFHLAHGRGRVFRPVQPSDRTPGRGA